MNIFLNDKQELSVFDGNGVIPFAKFVEKSIASNGSDIVVTFNPATGNLSAGGTAVAAASANGNSFVVITNDLTTGGATSALSAEQGVVLQAEIQANSNALATKGTAGGFASLDSTSKLLISQFPSLNGGSA